jgi:hypothetical protein
MGRYIYSWKNNSGGTTFLNISNEEGVTLDDMYDLIKRTDQGRAELTVTHIKTGTNTKKYKITLEKKGEMVEVKISDQNIIIDVRPQTTQNATQSGKTTVKGLGLFISDNVYLPLVHMAIDDLIIESGLMDVLDKRIKKLEQNKGGSIKLNLHKIGKNVIVRGEVATLRDELIKIMISYFNTTKQSYMLPKGWDPMTDTHIGYLESKNNVDPMFEMVDGQKSELIIKQI